ncbi:hypothetical protein L1887_39326 [Cichorium endivia]|nr:hypothetical protein L1887_39326 [Cichorium endivia]
MAYAYWKAGKHKERAVFDLYFRKNPFGGKYTVFAGLEECIRFIANFKLSKEEIAFVRETLSPTCEDAFFDYLEGIGCSDVKVYAIAEGSVVFPKIPLMRVEGPVAVVQLLETPYGTGPDGGIGASSNCAAGKIFGIPLRGTHSHAFVSSFMWFIT